MTTATCDSPRHLMAERQKYLSAKRQCEIEAQAIALVRQLWGTSQMKQR